MAPPSPTIPPPHSPANPPPAATLTSSTSQNHPAQPQLSNPSLLAAPIALPWKSQKAAPSLPPRSRTQSLANPTLPVPFERQTTACPLPWTTSPRNSSRLPSTRCPAISRHHLQSARLSAPAAQTAALQSPCRRCRTAPATHAHAIAMVLRALARKSFSTVAASDVVLLMSPALAAQLRKASRRVHRNPRMRGHVTRRRRLHPGALLSVVDAGDR